MKGNKKGSDDSRRYYIRITSYNENIFDFGSTWFKDSIKEKYQISLAMIKGVVLTQVPNSFIKDETNYMEYKY